MIPKRLLIAACVCLAVAVLWPPEAWAQRRIARVRPVRSVVVVGAGFYNPFFYSPFYWGAWYPGFGYGPYPFYAPYGYGYGPAISEARLQIKPRDAEVFVDGYYVGKVDRFDGVFQRLDLPPGEHEIVVYHDGYRTYRLKNLFRPGEGYKYQAALEPLAPGEAQEPRPKASSSPPTQQTPYAQPSRGERTRPFLERRSDERVEAAGFGTLAVRVQPADAIVTIDGERWDSAEGGSRLQLQLAAGRHSIEVRKEGFKSYSTSVEIRTGETETVNVSLLAGGGAP